MHTLGGRGQTQELTNQGSRRRWGGLGKRPEKSTAHGSPANQSTKPKQEGVDAGSTCYLEKYERPHKWDHHPRGGRSSRPRRLLLAYARVLINCTRSSSACQQSVGIKEGKRSFEPRNFLRVGEGIEARRKAGKRPELPKIGHHFGSGSGGSGGGGGGSLRQKGGAGLERGLQILPTRYPHC